MPSLTGTTELTVHVINVNDKRPYFTPVTQRAEVSADAEVGTVIHELMAEDPDVIEDAQLMFGMSARIITVVDKNGKEVGFVFDIFDVLIYLAMLFHKKIRYSLIRLSTYWYLNKCGFYRKINKKKPTIICISRRFLILASQFYGNFDMNLISDLRVHFIVIVHINRIPSHDTTYL